MSFRLKSWSFGVVVTLCLSAAEAVQPHAVEQRAGVASRTTSPAPVDLSQIPYALECTQTIGRNTSRFLFENPGRIGARVTSVHHSADIHGPQWVAILVHGGSPRAGAADGPAWIYEVSYRNPETGRVSRYELRLLRPEEGESATTVMAFYVYNANGDRRQGRDFSCRPYGARAR